MPGQTRPTARMRLGEMLLAAHVINEAQLTAALGEQKRRGGRLGEQLVKMGYLSEGILTRQLAAQLRIPIVDFSKFKIPPSVLDLVPAEVARRLHVVPLGLKSAEGRTNLFLAMSDPTDLAGLDEIRFLTQYGVQPVASEETALETALRFYYDGVGSPPYGESAVEPPRVGASPSFAPPPSLEPLPRPAPSAADETLPFADAKASKVLSALVQVLVEKGLLTTDEILRKLRG